MSHLWQTSIKSLRVALIQPCGISFRFSVVYMLCIYSDVLRWFWTTYGQVKITTQYWITFTLERNNVKVNWSSFLFPSSFLLLLLFLFLFNKWFSSVFFSRMWTLEAGILFISSIFSFHLTQGTEKPFDKLLLNEHMDNWTN